MIDDEVANLFRILRESNEKLTRKVMQLESQRKHDPYPDVFIADLDGTDFTEQAIVAGSIVDFTDGRSDAIVDLNGKAVLLSVRDGTRRRYVKVESCSGSGTGTTTVGISTEGTDTAIGDLWNISDGNSVSVWVQSRTEYDDAGDNTIYGFARLWSFNVCGQLQSIGAEARYTVDVPTNCADESRRPVATAIQTSDYTASSGDIIPVDPSGAGFTITLPLSPVIGDDPVIVKNITTSTNVISINGNGANIEGSATPGTTQINTARGSLTLFYYASGEWMVVE